MKHKVFTVFCGECRYFIPEINNCVLKRCYTTEDDYCKRGESRYNTETCVACGAEIPEGRQVCPNCERKENANG